MSTPRYSYSPIATQPIAHSQLPTSPSLESLQNEKSSHNAQTCSHSHGRQCRSSQCQDDCEGGSHRHFHNRRLKRCIIPILIASVALLLIGAAGCMLMGGMSAGASSSWNIGDIFSRAVADGTNGNGNQNTFINRKLYLIIIFVGLVLVVIAGIMLSAWCCKGAFQNPLCCPCYLCACCGGLACLECIGCGLCAEGLSEM